jgi:predicted kinase
VTIRLPEPCLVVLVGPSGSGKSTWAARWFPPAAIVAPDDLRGVVGLHRHDLRATSDALEVLDLIVAKRLRRGLLTVIDSTALDRKVRARYRALAAAAGVACHAVVVDTPERECRARNRGRPEAVPSAVLTSQLRAFATAVAALDETGHDGFDDIHHVRPDDGEPVVTVPAALFDAPAAARRQKEAPMSLRFGLRSAASPGRARPPRRRPGSGRSPAPPRRSGSRRSR